MDMSITVENSAYNSIMIPEESYRLMILNYNPRHWIQQTDGNVLPVHCNKQIFEV